MEAEPYTSSGDPGLLDDLNPAQAQAVRHELGPLLVVAGAGSGKTRVLTRRVAWLVSRGVRPWQILAITFTNKAARVLRERLGVLGLGDERGSGVFAGTFHGLAAWLLRRHGEHIGVDPRFTIADRDDQLRLIKTIIKEEGLKDIGLRPADFLAGISHLKNGAFGPSPVALDHADVEAAFDRVCRSYRKRLDDAALLDFDDLLLRALDLVRPATDEHPGSPVRAELMHRFQHVLVDEYQDTNLVQRDFLLGLCGGGRHLTVVGDPDQSIYRWRGAVVENILDFGNDYPGARTVLLEQNYRSTQRILAVAEKVIAQNTSRHDKRLFTENPEGGVVPLVTGRDAEDESEAIANVIEGWMREGARPDEIAVLYRVNSFSRGVEIALKRRRLPYQVVAGVEFFQRREVKDLISYLRLVHNPRDESAFERAVNMPRRGVGQTSLLRLRSAAQTHEIPLLDAAAHADRHGIKGRAKTGLMGFAALIAELRHMADGSIAELVKASAARSGYRKMLKESEDAVDQAREDNIDELIAFAQEIQQESPEATLADFLERTALVSDQDDVEEEGGRVALMSVHAAKGLEFPRVIVAGVELGYFPHQRNLDTDSAIEEERRLLYVALTRAKRHLTLTRAASRATWEGFQHRAPSPFISDLPPGLVETRSGSHAYQEERELPFTTGDRVQHPHFGLGTLHEIRGAGENQRLEVEFDDFGPRVLAMRYARLERAP